MYFIYIYGQQVKIRNTKKQKSNEFSCKLLFQESIFSIRDSSFHLKEVLPKTVQVLKTNYWTYYCADINKQYNYTINVGALWMTHFYVCLIHVGECAQLHICLQIAKVLKTLTNEAQVSLYSLKTFIQFYI